MNMRIGSVIFDNSSIVTIMDTDLCFTASGLKTRSYRLVRLLLSFSVFLLRALMLVSERLSSVN